MPTHKLFPQLITQARDAAKRTHSPYSRYPVGAALLSDCGKVFTGTNIENASYGLTVCAERVALFKAVSEGCTRFSALALAAGDSTPATPCGACLQTLSEFCPPTLPIACATLSGKGKPLSRTLKNFLPTTFSLARKTLAALLLLLAFSGAAAPAQDNGFGDLLPSGDTPSPAPTSGAELIAEGLQRIPLEPLTMTGCITMREKHGLNPRVFDFEVRVEWGAQPPTATYKIFTVGTTTLLETVTATSGAAPTLVRQSADPATPVPQPQWNDRIQETDLTWLDATMAFLWWEKPTLAGEEKVKGRLCDIVDLFPPTPIPGCAKMRVWLDREVKLLLKAEEFSPKGATNRRFWVEAVKKFNGRWMVKIFEVENRGTGKRTKLRIEEVKGIDEE